MIYKNVTMKGIGFYHPSKTMGNEYYIEHFRKQGFEISNMLNNLGRKNRYLATEDLDLIQMGITASERALENAGITADQLDMIVFVSETPEYTSPTNALKIHHFLQAKNAHITYDMNDCCTGMITAIDQVSRYMQTNPALKYALIVGGILITPHAHEGNPMFYATFGDASAAVVLESKPGEVLQGFVDSQYITDSSLHYTVQIPMCGFSKVHREDVDPVMKYPGNIPFDFGFLPSEWHKAITQLLERNGLTIDDVDHFIFSQFSLAAITGSSELMGFSMDRTTYVGDIYGYTGCTSPIIALSHALEEGKIKAGSRVVLISIGSGYSISAVLYQY